MQSMQPQEFIDKIAPAAQRSAMETGIFASLIIAQAALESGWGKTTPLDHKTRKESNNLFGIKGEGPAGHIECPHWEFENGREVWRMAKFRRYNNYEESIEDHMQLMLKDRYKPVRDAATPNEAAHQLYQSGYATDPKYAQKLISIMKKYNLHQYDND